LRWGVLGTGFIATEFIKDLGLLPGGESIVVAVGSRKQDSADAIGDRFGIAARYGSCEGLVADPNVDVVYVATPHPMHHATALLAIRAGKHVLIEKPFTLNAAEARDLVREAETAGTFLMEAMWSRFLPHMVEIQDILATGRLGKIVSVIADHGQWFAEDPKFRLFAPELGGGALLDLGIYVVSFASMVLGPPNKIRAASEPAFTGVDATTSVILQHAGGGQAVLNTTLSAESSNRAVIVGTEARLEIDSVFYRPNSYSVIDRDGEVQRHEHNEPGFGLRFQTQEVALRIAEGARESAAMPLSETIQIMETMDEVRQQIGLRYPSERDPLRP
jgi:predicted dehydrogenase